MGGLCVGEPFCYYVSRVTSALEQSFIRQCILLTTLDEKNALLNDFRGRQSMTLMEMTFQRK